MRKMRMPRHVLQITERLGVRLMQTTVKENQLEEFDTTSSFRMVVVAAMRAKQLLRGAKPRIETDPGRRKLTSIALEEVRRKLVGFKVGAPIDSYDDLNRPLVGLSTTNVHPDKTVAALT